MLRICQVNVFSRPKPEADTSRPSCPSENKETFWLVPHTHWKGEVFTLAPATGAGFKTREEYLKMGLPNILTGVRLVKEHPNCRFVLDQVANLRQVANTGCQEPRPQKRVLFRDKKAE